MDTNLVLNAVVPAIIVSLVGVIAYFARTLIKIGEDYLRQRIGIDQVESLKGMAKTVVNGIQQSIEYTDYSGEQKKELATAVVHQMLDAANIKVQDEWISLAIEEAVKAMKNEPVK